MEKARKVGNYIEWAVKENGLSSSYIVEEIGVTENQLEQFYKGRLFLSYSQLVKLAGMLNLAVGEVLKGNHPSYEESFSDKFDNPQNREMILDIIDNYMDIVEAINIIEEEQ